MYFVYIVKCADNSLYTGITTDLDRREKQHNWQISGGAKYTLSRIPVKIVYFEKLENRSLATKREIEIKKLTKKQKLQLILDKMKNNELYKKLKNFTINDAIKYEENDRQFIALKNLWENIEKIEWEKNKKIFFYLSLVLANSLVCYQLSGKWEDYWEEFSEFFADKFQENFLFSDIIDLMANFLKNCKKNKRFTDMKIARLSKFEPFLEEFLGQEKYFYENMLELRDKIAKIMKQKKDAKTVVFAVKMFSYAARNIFEMQYFPKELMIPIDSRLTSMYEKYQNWQEKIEDFYIELSELLGISMMHLDGIIWTSFDDLMED